MTLRKHTPLHDKWHRRVEGQIRHTMNVHPEWFTFTSEWDKTLCVNSLAKRIVGEIFADSTLATVAGKDAVAVSCSSVGDGDASLPSTGAAPLLLGGAQ